MSGHTHAEPLGAGPGPDFDAVPDAGLDAGLDAASVLSMRDVSKTFTLHLRGGTVLPVVEGAALELVPGRCTALDGPSGIGKSSLLKMIHGSYRIDTGSVLVRHAGATIDLARADDRTLVRVRRDTVGHVGQFLRVVPRVSALDVVAAPLVALGTPVSRARTVAASLLARLNMPEPLWSLPPATFSGGEQQRVSVARGFAGEHPILLLDEPTASLDAVNRGVVIELVRERKASGTAILGIFHDAEVRDAVADELVNVRAFAPGRASATDGAPGGV